MSACRVACRIASMRAPENPCSDGGGRRTLATKVFHLLFQLFLVCPGTGWWRTAGRGMADAQGLRQGSSAGVWPSPKSLNTRRLALPPAPGATPFNTSTLVTKGCRNEVVS
jgi:hypothetical protein